MITRVAILDAARGVWSVPKPGRHHDVIHLMREAGVRLVGHVQGFLNDRGQFVDRRAAFQEALACGQVLPPYNPTNPSQRRWDLGVDPEPRELFSEDLW